MNLFNLNDMTVFQGETNECGLACLSSVFRHYQRHIGLPELRHNHGNGLALSLEQMAQLAQRYGFQTRCLRCEPEDLSKLALPAILHVDFDHYVVLTKMNSGGLHIMDPGRGLTRWSWSTLGQRFTGIVLELTPGPSFEPAGRPIRYSPIKLLRRLPTTHLVSTLACLLALSIIVQLFALATPFYLQVVVDEVLLSSNIDMATLVVSGFAAVYVLSALTQWMRGLLTIRLGTQLSFMLSSGLLRHAINLPMSFFARRSIGDIVSRFGSLRPVQEFLTDSAIVVLLDLLMIASTLIMLSCFSGSVTLYVTIATVLFVVVQYALLQPYRQHHHAFLMSDAEVQTHFIETLQAIHTIKRFEATAARDNEWQNRLTTSLNSQIRASRWALGAEVYRYLYSGLLILGVGYLAIDDILANAMTIGMLYTLIAYANHFSAAVLSITQQWQSYMMLALHSQRVADLSDHPTDDRLPLVMREPLSLIELDNIAIQFPAHSRTLIERLSLSVSKHQSVAITGLSGSGKSSLLNILTGEQMPATGEVRINGQPLNNQLKTTHLFSSLSPGDGFIQGTVIDNIVFGLTRIDQERLLCVTRIADVHEDILRLPLGYQEKLSEHGATLSAGQKQRLLIARTLYRTADVLILDEATSHLDVETERRIMQRILAMPVTCFFVTHNPAIAALADHIINLDDTKFHQAPDFAAG